MAEFQSRPGQWWAGWKQNGRLRAWYCSIFVSGRRRRRSQKSPPRKPPAEVGQRRIPSTASPRRRRETRIASPFSTGASVFSRGLHISLEHDQLPVQRAKRQIELVRILEAD